MIIHASLRWPQAQDLSLWPFCLEHSVYIWNRLPSNDGLSPDEKWYSCKSDHAQLKHLHPWSFPAYVLEAKLQDGKKLPEFSPHSRQGLFLGYSPQHASSVALVLNRRTKQISPQFHILFDDFFSTVRGVDCHENPDLINFDWSRFIKLHGTEEYFDRNEPDGPPPLDNDWLDPNEREIRLQRYGRNVLRFSVGSQAG